MKIASNQSEQSDKNSISEDEHQNSNSNDEKSNQIQNNVKKQQNQQMLLKNDCEINQNIPFEKYRKSFPVFKSVNKIHQLKSYIKIKTPAHLNSLKQYLMKLLSNQNLLNQSKQSKTTNIFSDANPLQHYFPSTTLNKKNRTTIFIHVLYVDRKRCNILIMNPSGYVFGYFSQIKVTRKFYKIYKVMKKIGGSSLFIIYDQLAENLIKQATFLKQLSDYAKQFCYYCRFEDSFREKRFMNIDLEQKKIFEIQRKKQKEKQKLQQKEKQQQQLQQKEKQKLYVWIEKQTFWFFSNIFMKDQSQLANNLQKIRQIQLSLEQQTQNQMKINISDKKMHFALQCMLTNYWKVNQFQSFEEMVSNFLKITNQQDSVLKQQNKIQYGNPNHHFLQPMKACKQCIHCPKNRSKLLKLQESIQKFLQPQMQLENQQKQKKEQQQKYVKKTKKREAKQQKKKKQEPGVKIRKTKYRCEGCTAEIKGKKDIALCIQCCEDYHIQKERAKQRYKKKQESREKSKQKKKLQLKMLESIHNNNDQICHQQIEQNQNKSNIVDMQISHNNFNENNVSNKSGNLGRIIEKNHNQTVNSKQKQSQNLMQLDQQLQMYRFLNSERFRQRQKFKQILKQIASQKKTFLRLFSQLNQSKSTKNFARFNAMFMINELIKKEKN